MSISSISTSPVLLSSLTLPKTATSTSTAQPAISSAAVQDVARFQSIATQAADGLNIIQNGISQLTALANEAASGSVTNNQRDALNTQYQAEYKTLKEFVASDRVDGTALFKGNFSVNAGSSLGKYLFTGAANQPTADQAKLSLPKILAGLKGISLSSQSGAASAVAALKTTGQTANNAAIQIGDFTSAITFANNTLHGKPNTGSSITQLDTLTQAGQIASGVQQGLVNIAESLQQLQSLATQAESGGITDTNRGFLNQQFQSVLNNINSVVNNTVSSQGNKLLDGSLNEDVSKILAPYLFTGAPNQPTAAQADLKIGNLSTSGLFGNATLDVSTQSGAQNAIAAITAAGNTLVSAANSLSGFQYAIGFAANNINIANGAPASPPAGPVQLIPGLLNGTPTQPVTVQPGTPFSLVPSTPSGLPSAPVTLITGTLSPLQTSTPTLQNTTNLFNILV